MIIISDSVPQQYQKFQISKFHISKIWKKVKFQNYNISKI